MFPRRLPIVLALAGLVAAAPTGEEPGFGVTGTVVRHEAFASREVEARNVDVWLPPGYDRDGSKRYAVIYMHDGQNLFDPATSYGGVDWAIDEILTGLIASGRARPAIVVGIWNAGQARYAEYMPQRAVAAAANQRDRLISDRYLKFIVAELKPFIDAHYRTRPGRDDTFIMGSSMGGLISAYAVSEYPEVFGGAACVSTHWPAEGGVAIDYLAANLPAPGVHRLYFDFGTATLDAGYEPYQQRMDWILRRRGYVAGEDWITRKFESAEHSEKAWRLRAGVPLQFLLRPR
ncbi:MAG: alpha/beta hydrolase [Steroidobacteraceae bacterium]